MTTPFQSVHLPLRCRLPFVSRAFVKETDAPEVVLGFYRAHHARSRFDFDLEIEFESDDLLEVLRFVARHKNGWQVRDADGVLLFLT
jgi:hypothetical protein